MAPALSEGEEELELMLTSGDREEGGEEGGVGDSLLLRETDELGVAPPPASPSMEVERPTSKLSRIEEERDEEVARSAKKICFCSCATWSP